MPEYCEYENLCWQQESEKVTKRNGKPVPKIGVTWLLLYHFSFQETFQTRSERWNNWYSQYSLGIFDRSLIQDTETTIALSTNASSRYIAIHPTLSADLFSCGSQQVYHLLMSRHVLGIGYVKRWASIICILPSFRKQEKPLPRIRSGDDCSSALGDWSGPT